MSFDETDSGHDLNPYSHDDLPQQRQKMSGCAKAGIGCGIVAVVLMIAAGIGAWWLANNFRAVATNAGAVVMKKALAELDLPDDQRQRINARIDDIGDKFKSGEITDQQMAAIFENVVQSPLIPAGAVLIARKAYIDNSNLDEAERDAGGLALNRFVRGCMDDLIPQGRIDDVLDHITARKNGDRREFKQSLTDEELRAFISEAKAAADEVGVAEVVPDVNFADEFDKAVDEALGLHADGPAEPDFPAADSEATEHPVLETAEPGM